MPTNNFLQWNPNQANQETDSQYNADSQRSGGAPVGVIFPSALANKLFYQLATMVAAMASYLVAQGQNAQDGNLATLAANIQAAIATQIANFPSVVSVPFSSTPTFNAASGTTFEITLTGNVTSSTLSNVFAGQRITFIIHQDATGSRTFVFPTNVLSSGTIDPGVSNTSVQEFIVGADLNVRPLSAMTVS